VHKWNTSFAVMEWTKFQPKWWPPLSRTTTD